MGQVSFMLDTWLDRLRQSYLAVTAHWIAEVEGTSNLQLKTALIVFHHLCWNHTRKSLVRTVAYLLDRARVMTKVRPRLRSCSNRQTFMISLLRLNTSL